MKFLFTFIFSFIAFFSIAQRNITSRLQIEAGSSVYFYFNSFNKINNGISYNDWTKLSVYYIDVDGGGASNNTRWALDVKANDSDIRGEAGNTLDLRTIQIEADYISGSNDGTTTYLNDGVGVELSDTDENLVDKGLETGAVDGPTKVSISYHCGKNAGYELIGEEPDFYFIDIIFTLRPEIAP